MPEHLRQALREGDPEALRKLMRELSEPLYRYAQAQLKDGQFAQDIVQQTFIRLWKNRRKLKQEGSLRTYCFFIATNLVRDTRRRETLRRKRESEGAEMRQQHDRNELAEEAFEHAMNLPEELREVVLLRFAQGFTALEAAEVLGIPEGTVKTRQRSALEKLRDKLGLAMAPAVGLPELEGSISEGAKTSVKVPTSLVANVEALVMASIGTQTGVSLAIVAGVLVLLLMAGGVVVGASWFLSAGESAPLNAEPIAVEDAGETQQGSNVAPPLDANSGLNETGNTGGTDETTDETVISKTPGSENQPDLIQLTFRGRVTDGDGKGIGGAYVRVSGSEASTEHLASDFSEWGVGTPALPGERWDAVSGSRDSSYGSFQFEPQPDGVYSDTAGYFELSAPGRATGDGAEFKFAAFAVGYRGGDLTVAQRVEDGEVIEHTIQMFAAQRCLTFTTDPVAELPLRVELHSQHGTMLAISTRTSIAGPNGLHQVELDSDLINMLRVKAPGYLLAEQRLRDDGQIIVKGGEIRLERGRVVAGVVEDEAGVPVSGAILRLDGSIPDYVQTDEEGAFKIAGIDGRAHKLAVRHFRYATAQVRIPEGKSDERTLRVELSKGVNVGGVVQFVGMQAPEKLNEIRVVMTDAEAGEESSVFFDHSRGIRIDDTYAFEFERVSPGDYIVRAAIEDRLSTPVPVRVEDKPVECTVVFGGGGRVSGTVIGQDGQPLAGARVSLVDFEAMNGSQPQVKTDASGRYEFIDVEPGKYIVLLEEHDTDMSEGLFARRRITVDGENVVFDIDLSALPPGNRVHGRVTLDGQPLFNEFFLMGTGVNVGIWRARAGADGGFEINGVPPGDYYLYGSSNKSRHTLFRQSVSFSGWTGEQEVERSLGSAALSVKLLGEGLSVEKCGVIVRHAGEGEFGPELVLTMMTREITAPNDGVCLFKNLVAGRYEVIVHAPGYATQARTVDAGADTAVEITMVESLARAELTLAGVAPKLKGVCYVQVKATDVDGAPVIFSEPAQLLDGNMLETPNLAPGNYVATVMGSDIEPSSKEFTVSAGEVAKVILQASLGASVTFRVNDANVPDAAIQSAAVSVVDNATGRVVRIVGPMSPMLLGMPESSDERVIRVGPLKAGDYTITINALVYAPVTSQVTLAKSESKELSLQLSQE